MPTSRVDPLLLTALAITQTVGWGATYYLPSAFSVSLQRDLGFSPAMVFSAVTALLVTGALMAPFVGRYLEHARTMPVLVACSVGSAGGLALLSQAQGLWSYLAAWVVIGSSSATILTLTSHVAIVRSSGKRAQNAITILAVVGGLSVAVFWPLTEYLLRHVSWRDVALVYALLNLAVCAPLHAFAVGRADRRHQKALSDPDHKPHAIASRLDPEARRSGFWLAVLAFASAGFVSWGLPLHFIAIFQEAGIAFAVAVWLGSLSGPSQVLARAIQWLWLDKVADPVKIALWSAVITVPVVIAPLLFGFSVIFAFVFVVTYGLVSGWVSLARSTLPLVLFGSGGFATLIGRLALPLNLTFAASPTFYAFVMERTGTRGAIVMSLVLLVVSALAFWRLDRLARPATA
ncbi:MAG: MFS transporter [Bosea sp. (in: a-proteobacteria)]